MVLVTNRRNFLRLAGTVAGLVFSGCLEIPEAQPPEDVGLETLVNNSGEWYRKHVAVAGYPTIGGKQELGIGTRYGDDIREYPTYYLYSDNARTGKPLMVVDVRDYVPILDPPTMDPARHPLYTPALNPKDRQMKFTGTVTQEVLSGSYVLVTDEYPDFT